MYPASVWRRKFGGFFVEDKETDAKTWGVEERTDEDLHVTH